MKYNNINDVEISEMSITKLLLRKTEKKELFWIPFSKIIQYLNEEGISISDVPEIYDYIVFLQRNRYIPDMEKNTYISFFESKLIILSKGRYSSFMKLAIMNLRNSKKRWEIVDASQIMFIRLRNAIELSEIIDTRLDIENFLYSMKGIRA